MLTKALLASLALAAAAAGGDDAVARYTDGLAKVRAAKTKVSLAELYEDAQAAADVELRQVTDPDDSMTNGRSAIPEGLLVSTEEALFAVPDPSFFDKLAKEHGTDADIAFFRMLRSSYDGAWPTWMKQETDVTGCTRFDAGIVDLYRQVAADHPQWPSVYRERQKAIRHDLEESLSGSDCGCGEEKDTRAGLKAILDAFPKSPIAPALRDCLGRLKKSGMRSDCGSN